MNDYYRRLRETYMRQSAKKVYRDTGKTSTIKLGRLRWARDIIRYDDNNLRGWRKPKLHWMDGVMEYAR